MDKLEKYQKILIGYLTEYAKRKPVNLPDVENQVIADITNNHFQFTYVGWQDDKFIFSTILHFDIKNDKIWVQRNNTERLIDQELVECGVRAEDIVLGFQPDYVRERLEKVAV